MTVPAVERMLDLIELFAGERRAMSVSAIANAIGMPVSSCHGLVKTLEARGYLTETRARGGYYFTHRLEQQVTAIGGFDPMPSWLAPALRDLRDRSGETVLLAKRVDRAAVYLEVLESAQSIRYAANIGDRFPLHTTAVGKALLGIMSADERNDTLGTGPLARRTPATITGRDRLERDLAESAQRGWYLTLGEYLSENGAVAIPLAFGPERYAVAVAGPASRIADDLDGHAKLLRSVLARPHDDAPRSGHRQPRPM